MEGDVSPKSFSGINLHDVVESLSRAIDLVSGSADKPISGHSGRVAYICMRIADRLELDEQQKTELFYATLLHDMGVVSHGEYLSLMSHLEWAGAQIHCRAGYRLLKGWPFFGNLSEIVLFHHDKWSGPYSGGRSRGEIPLASWIIRLANDVDLVYSLRRESAAFTMDLVKNQSGHLYQPELADCLLRIMKDSDFWLGINSPDLEGVLTNVRPGYSPRVPLSGLKPLARMFASLVDAKSVFTHEHSKGVARLSAFLAKELRFSDPEVEAMEVAGLLHDLGKLAVPNEILEKNGRLTESEYALVRTHAYHTYTVLHGIPGLSPIPEWASCHHERLDGSGYPFRIGKDHLTKGMNIVAVSDVFQALTEDRPYRRRMDLGGALATLDREVKEGRLDGDVVEAVRRIAGDIKGDVVERGQALSG